MGQIDPGEIHAELKHLPTWGFNQGDSGGAPAAGLVHIHELAVKPEGPQPGDGTQAEHNFLKVRVDGRPIELADEVEGLASISRRPEPRQVDAVGRTVLESLTPSSRQADLVFQHG